MLRYNDLCVQLLTDYCNRKAIIIDVSIIVESHIQWIECSVILNRVFLKTAIASTTAVIKYYISSFILCDNIDIVWVFPGENP